MAEGSASNRSNLNKNVILLCGFTGFAIGVWLWLAPAIRTREVREPSQDSIAVLSSDDASNTKATITKAEGSPDDPPAIVALRNGWTYLLHQQDIDSAHQLILTARITDSVRQTQLVEFADSLLQRDWLNPKDFPDSTYFIKVKQTEGSLDRMFGYWRMAYEVGMKLPPSPEKVSILGRLDVMAKILSHMQSSPDASAIEKELAMPPGMQQFFDNSVSKSGSIPAQNQIQPRVMPEASPSKTIDLTNESQKIRAETIATIEALSQKRRFDLSFAGNFVWNLLRTGFLAISGSIIGAIGVVFNKKIVALITAPLIHGIQHVAHYLGLDDESSEKNETVESNTSESPDEKPA